MHWWMCMQHLSPDDKRWDRVMIHANIGTEPGRLSPVPERRLTITESVREAITEEMARDQSVFLIGEDIGIPGGFGGAWGVYQGLAEKFGSDRIIDTPISEKAIMGSAVGAALMGMRPIADMQYADFLFECMDEVVNQAAKMRYMSGGNFSVPLVVRCPVGAAGVGAGAQHGQCPESYFIHVPGLKIVSPSDAYNAKGIMKSAIRDNDPVLVFEHKLLYGTKGRQQAGGADLKTAVPVDDYVTPIGKAAIKRHGTDVTVVATHLTLYRCLAAADRLADDGISLEVIDPITLRPFDTDTIFKSVFRTRRLVIAHEDTLIGGWGAELAAQAADECLRSLEAPIKRIAAHEVPLPAAPLLEQEVVPSIRRIVATIKDLLTYVR
jgi:pyruvate/2-oxoglutarate/acetoin dehydrogenase E1 component